jgi:glycosyltransferase involved in cell wall biosynthesis
VKVLHVAPHLGGGIGKAHAVMSVCMPAQIEQTFCLLEEPIDKRFYNILKANGNKVVVAESRDHIGQLAREVDIVQFEYINHPRLIECMARTDFGNIRSVVWAHNSGLYKPIFQPKMMDEAARFVFSTGASLPLAGDRTNVAVINSGFGFGPAVRSRPKRLWPRMAYLGTVNFIKMHPKFFEVVDELDHVGPVLIWGTVDSLVAEAASKMKHPTRVKFLGETMYPAQALIQADVFLYLLQPKHYGTGENALVEAMSLGLTPVVLGHPCEMEIVKHDHNGIVVENINKCASWVNMLLSSPSMRERYSKNAMSFANDRRSPKRSTEDFVALWYNLIDESKRYCDFEGAFGNNPAEWFLATQFPRGYNEKLEDQWYNGTIKGSLAHFKKVFANDQSFAAL